MRFLIDAQLPPALARFIQSAGQEAKAVREVGLRDSDDASIWKFAREGDWVVVTKDEDFVDRTMGNMTGPKVVWLRIGNCTNRALLDWLEPVFAEILRELGSGSRIVEVVKPNRSPTIEAN